jgi:DNA modification methylase
LTDNGSLFIHWSLSSPLDVRLVMNQAFGDDPKYEITLHKKKTPNVVRGRPKNDSEFILVYSKSDNPIFNPIFRPLNSEEKAAYSRIDERGPYCLNTLIRPCENPMGQFTWRGYQLPPNRSWRFSFEKLEDLAQENRIHFPHAGGLPSLKRYLNDHPGIEIGTTWDDIPNFIPTKERYGFASQTPLPLMERIVRVASNMGDYVLDPFCGSGTTLVAAESLGRRWWGADNSLVAHQSSIDRLQISCGLAAGRDYAVLNEQDVKKWPVTNSEYREVVSTIDEIVKLQKQLYDLTENIISLKKLMNIDKDDEEGIEKIIQKIQDLIITDDNCTKNMESYIGVVCSWLTGWDRLDETSQSFLPQAEFLFEIINLTNGKDYSPFILQYCRALENELLTKLFTAYTEHLYNRHFDINMFLANDIINEKTVRFAKAVQTHQCKYTLGDMNYILGLMRRGGKTLESSTLLQDFRGGVQYQLQHLSVNSACGLVKTLHHGSVDADRCKVAVDRPGPLVESLRDRIKLFLAVEGQVCPLGEVLAEEAVGVLAGPPLPRAMGVAEVDLDPGLGGQLGMARHLLPLVVGQGLAHGRRDTVQLAGIACQGGGGGGIVHLGQQDQARGPFDQDPHRRTVTRPLDEVALPVAGQGAVLHRRRTYMNTEHISQLPASIRTPRVRQAGTSPFTQASDQFLAQGTPRQGVEAGVNGLGGDPPLRGIRPHHLQGAGNLTGDQPSRRKCSTTPNSTPSTASLGDRRGWKRRRRASWPARRAS